eukprot:760284-Hanusia_phi.AAC.4
MEGDKSEDDGRKRKRGCEDEGIDQNAPTSSAATKASLFKESKIAEDNSMTHHVNQSNTLIESQRKPKRHARQKKIEYQDSNKVRKITQHEAVADCYAQEFTDTQSEDDVMPEAAPMIDLEELKKQIQTNADQIKKVKGMHCVLVIGKTGI